MVNFESGLVRDTSVSAESTNMQELTPILKSIIITRCKDGATIDEIIGDYKEQTGENLLSIFRNRDAIGEYLRRIDGVWSTFNVPTGPYLWYCNTPRAQHIADMIKKQKSPRKANVRNQQQTRYQPSRTVYASNSNDSNSDQRDKFFEDNKHFISKRGAWNRVQQRNAVSHPYMPPQRRQMQYVKPALPWNYNASFTAAQPAFFGYQMIGDDFFLSLAKWEMGHQFNPEPSKIKQCGLCISGLTLAEAADRVMKAPHINDRVIVNVGIVDILHGHDFVDMQQDLLRLIKNLEIRGATVLLTTLSPIANSSHVPGVTDCLRKFNDFIRREHWMYIDIWDHLVDEKGRTLFGCFQPGPRHVSGSNKAHVLWNKLGRQRIIKFLKTELGAFM